MLKKKLSYLVMMFLFIFIGMGRVKATYLSVSSENVNVGKSVTVQISDFTEGNTYSLDFTSDYFVVSDNSCGNRSAITANCELKLTAKSSLSLTENKAITLTLAEIANNDSDKTKTITIKANKTVTTASTTTTTTTTTTTATTIVKKSNNANLKTLVIKGNDDSDVVIDPVFSPTIYEYNATVSGEVSNVVIEPIAEDVKSSIVISPNYGEELVAGENNKIVITITAEDGSQKAYNINIKREALEGNAIIKELEIKEYPDFKFEEDKFKYIVKVAESVDKLSISYVTENENILVDITGNEKLKDGSIVRLLVTAPDGSKKEYTLAIQKEKETNKSVSVKEEKNPIVIISLSLVAVALVTSIIIVAVKKR